MRRDAILVLLLVLSTGFVACGGTSPSPTSPDESTQVLPADRVSVLTPSVEPASAPIVALASTATPTRIPPPTPEPTAVPSPTATPTPSLTPTPTATPTPAPEPSPTPKPTSAAMPTPTPVHVESEEGEVQIFDVSLTLLPPEEQIPIKPYPTCTDGEWPYAASFSQQIEATTLQFRFAAEGGRQTVSLSATNLDKPMSIGSDSAELRTDGSTFTFEDLGAAAGASWLVFKTGRISLSDSDGDGLPDELLLSEAEGRFEVIMGDWILQCVFAATGDGGLDTTPPTFFLGEPLRYPFWPAFFMTPCAPCFLWADESFALWSSELVRLGGIEKLIEVVDSNGAEVRFLPDVTETAEGFAFSAMGFWPLGQTISVTVNPGLLDRAANPTSESFTQTYKVVDDPGLLDNFGFETADFSGFIASGHPLEVTESFLGIRTARRASDGRVRQPGLLWWRDPDRPPRRTRGGVSPRSGV